jgi:2-hydroxy-6-oxonona-2,4-dienedioate hydrolase
MSMMTERDPMAPTTLWPSLMAGEYRLRYVQAGPLRTRCLETGSGSEALILLHGSGGHLETYTRNVLPLGERYRVFAIDMIGHGFTDKPDYDYEISHYVRHLVDFMDAMDIGKAHLSGESLGGWVAARFAIDHPDRLGRLILNTAGGLTANADVMRRIYDLSMKAVTEADRENVRKRLEWLMHDPAVVTDDLTETRLRVYTQPGFVTAMEHILCLQLMDIRLPNLLDEAALKTVAAPTLVIWTSHDPTGAVEVGQKFADLIPDAALVVMDGCGHWPQYEDAPLFNRLVLDFLAR